MPSLNPIDQYMVQVFEYADEIQMLTYMHYIACIIYECACALYRT